MRCVMTSLEQKELFAKRMTALQIRKGAPEYETARVLGMSGKQLKALLAGEHLPKMETFFDICAYYEITPQEFFDPTFQNSEAIREAGHLLGRLPATVVEDMLCILRLLEKKMR